MNLTPLGAKVAQFGDKEKEALGKKLVGGEKISKYTAGICYDTVAFTRYMLGSSAITSKDLTSKTGEGWNGVFKFTNGKKWTGSGMSAGDAVGFYRLVDKKVFHAAIATGNGKVRAVNGHLLGNGWSEADLKKQLGDPDANGQFDYDRTKIEVYISKA